jgi:DNA-binding IclR family transcriptional regulator
MIQQTTDLLPKKHPKKDLIGSVQRALRIMELLAHHPVGLNAKKISMSLQINLGTCYHLLNTLEHSGYVVKDPDHLLFRLSGKIGYTMFDQASPAQLVKHLYPHVQTLQEITQETAYLSIWDGREITLSAIVETPQTVRVKALAIGDIGANHASALGKAILAFLDQVQFDHYFAARPLPAFTFNTIINLKTLKEYLEQVQQQGYALDIEEFMAEVHCIGAPIFDACNNVTASIAISLPASRADGNQPGLIAKVKRMADAASRTLQILGYVSPAASSED